MAENKTSRDFEITAGNMCVRLARNDEEIRASQRLRYSIFYEEMGGVASQQAQADKMDIDAYDPHCDHLLVFDMGLDGIENQVIGSYRLLRRKPMEQVGSFYSESEFNIDSIKNYEKEILELGRSCVHENYRSRSVMQLLWRGIGAYLDCFDIALMFGCASFIGTDPKEHATSLSYLYHYHMGPETLRPKALQERYVQMNLMPKEEIHERRAFAALPALIKGYLRLGGYVGEGAVVDPDCNTLDVSIVVITEDVTDKYSAKYASAGKTEE